MTFWKCSNVGHIYRKKKKQKQKNLADDVVTCSPAEKPTFLGEPSNVVYSFGLGIK
jgi:hypothetical protein